jgi:putative sterol carrier protein
MKYLFLSDEWVEEAQRVYAEAGPVLGTGAEATPVKVNLVVSSVPFSGEPINAHIDTSGGTLTMGHGHLSEPDVTVSMDYATARALFVGGDAQAAMQAFLSGKIRIDGNLSKLLDPKSGIWPTSQPAGGSDQGGSQLLISFGAAPLTNRLQEITA